MRACRICGNEDLVSVLELGNQTLTGVFPKRTDEAITEGPLTLVKCTGENKCGLLQLAHSYSLEEMYGENYGYRSGLNPSMVAHLKSKVERIKNLNIIQNDDIIVDIGSNDATTLKQYGLDECRLVGIDPTASKFEQYYTDNIELIAEFFNVEAYKERFGEQKVKIVTSFSMFYDLEDPMAFMREVAEILDDNGVWEFEQSYMPLMLSTNSYDTVCHEHLEYYSLSQILWMAKRVGLKIVDVEINSVNGGSFSVTAQKEGGDLSESPAVSEMIESERSQKLDDLQTYIDFAIRAEKSKGTLLNFLQNAKSEGKKVVCLGASTKGNVILQYCGIDSSLISAIGEVNPDKFGSFTPGTHIPILNEEDVISGNPDYFLVLPWHFKAFFESQNCYSELNLVYPLPELSFRYNE